MNETISVLLVDDDEMVRSSIREWLLDDGFIVLCAASGSEALQLMADTRCDAVLTDLNLGDMSGEVFLMQALRSHQDTGYAIHTGSHDYCLSPELRRMGMQDSDVLYKPVKLGTLSAQIVKMVERSHGGTG